MRLRARYAALFAALAIATAALVTLFLDATIRRAVEERVLDRLARERDHLASDLSRFPAGEEAARDAFLRKAASDLGCRITLIASDGRVLEESARKASEVAAMDNHGSREEIRRAREAGEGRSRRYSATERRETLYFARRLPNGAFLRLGMGVDTLREVEQRYLWTTRLAVLATCLLLFLVGSAASRRFTEPIAELTRAASAVAAGDFERDLPRAEGSEEVQLLGASLQRMKDALNQALARAEGEQRLTAMVFERLPEGLVVVDSKLRVLEANGRFAEMTGVPAPAGRGVYEVLREKSLYDCFETTVRTGEISEKTVRMADDSVWQIKVAPLPEGHRAAAVGVLRDVTRLEKTEAMRRTFVADVSHELRTPIASIAAAAETLRDGQADASERAELAAVVERQAARMQELIDDLMDLSQIESGSVPLEREEIPLPELLSEVAADLAAPAREKGVAVRVTGDPSVRVMGDRRRLGQLARNLLDNAIKFSPTGSPVSLRVVRDASGRPGFSVIDMGPGIPKAERDKIFQRFYQVDRSRSKARPGSGLGLAIVKHIAQLHGASVEVEGEPGQGSMFHVRFPAG